MKCEPGSRLEKIIPVIPYSVFDLSFFSLKLIAKDCRNVSVFLLCCNM